MVILHLFLNTFTIENIQETDEDTPTLHWMCFPQWNSANSVMSKHHVANWNMAIEIVSFSTKKREVPIVLLNSQRVKHHEIPWKTIIFLWFSYDFPSFFYHRV